LQTHSTNTLPDSRPQAAKAGSPDAPPAIETRGLTKRYGGVTALDGLSMTVPRGEIFGFLGPNGAGKTTTVKLLLGLARPTAGEAWILGEPAGGRRARQRIGYLPELFRYQAWLSAQEVLELHAELAGIPPAARRSEVRGALDAVGLVRRADDRVGTFSKGMQQRLGIGVALLGAPELIFLDEPTSALDPVGRHDVREIIRELRQRGTTVFLNSHLLSEVEQVCDRVAVVDRGRAVATGGLDQLLGVSSTVRLRVAGLTSTAEAAIRAFGAPAIEGEWYTFQGIAEETVPDLVAAIVSHGGRVYAVEPRHQTLEDRFLQILGGPDGGNADHRSSHPA
jgi:ABC-2 type transport system ATP-binding protein